MKTIAILIILYGITFALGCQAGGNINVRGNTINLDIAVTYWD